MKNIPEPNDEILTVEEVASLLKLHVQTVYRKIEQQELPGMFRLGEDNKAIRFSKRVILEWINKEASRP